MVVGEGGGRRSCCFPSPAVAGKGSGWTRPETVARSAGIRQKERRRLFVCFSLPHSYVALLFLPRQLIFILQFFLFPLASSFIYLFIPATYVLMVSPHFTTWYIFLVYVAVLHSVFVENHAAFLSATKFLRQDRVPPVPHLFFRHRVHPRPTVESLLWLILLFCFVPLFFFFVLPHP